MGSTPALLEDLTKTVTQDTPFSEAEVWLALFTATPGPSGLLHEVTTGTGAKGRQRPSFAGSGGTDANTTPTALVVTPTTNVRWYGYFSAQTGGTFLGAFPLVSTPKIGTAVAGTELVVPAHGYMVGTTVRLFPLAGVQSAVPTGATEDETYFVVSVVDANTITISATTAGTPVTFSSAGGFQIAEDRSQNITTPSRIVFNTGDLVYQTVS